MSIYAYFACDSACCGDAGIIMPQSNTTDNSSSVLKPVGEILRALSPPAIGLLFAIDESDEPIQTQADLGDAIGRSQSSVSQFKSKLEEEVDPPLISRRGRRYTLTKTGEIIIDLIGEIASTLDVDLDSIDWTNETDKETVGTLLSPLYNSHDMVPLFILDSLSERSQADSSDESPNPVWVDDVFYDVDAQYPADEEVTLKKVRRTLRERFDDTDTARFDGSEVTLLEKGQQQAWLVDELSKHIEEEEAVEQNLTDSTATESPTETTIGRFDSDSAIRPDSTDRGITIDRGGQRITEQTSLGSSRQQSVLDSVRTSETPTVIPAYSLHPDEGETDDGSGAPLILPPTMTVDDALDRILQARNDFDADTRLVLNWAIQTETGLYPWTPAEADSPDTTKKERKKEQ
jgi:DNA-binding MarR family transcriptional regulator